MTLWQRVSPEQTGGRTPEWRSGLAIDARLPLDLADVGGLEPLRPLGHLELDLVTLGQALEALGLDGVEMHEHVVARLLGDEAIALRVVEPLDRSLCHEPLPLCSGAGAPVDPRHHGGGALRMWKANKNAAEPGVLAALNSNLSNLQPSEPET